MDLSEVARGPKRRLGLAKRDFEAAEAEVMTWVSSEPLYPEFRASADRHRIDVILHFKSEPPLDVLSELIGGAVHHLRSALDHLMWGLAHVDGSPAKPTRVQFPVCLKRSSWNDALKDLESVPGEALERIRMYQPFLADDPELTELSLIHQLDIADKHRDFLTCTPLTEEAAIDLDAIGIDAPTDVTPWRIGNFSDLHDGQVFASMEFSTPFRDLPLSGRLSLGANYLIHMEKPPCAVSLLAMAQVLPIFVEDMIDTICGLKPLSRGPEFEVKEVQNTLEGQVSS
jgi:hypothetical protein